MTLGLRARVVGVAAVLAASAWLMLSGMAAPAKAASCPSPHTVASYSGTASLSYDSGTFTGSDGGGGTITMSISHSGQGLELNGLKPDKAGVDFSSSSQPTGGTVKVNDQWTDTSTSGSASTSQSASGPNYAQDSQADVSFNTDCTYTVDVEYAIKTKTQGSSAGPHDPGIADTAITANIPENGSLDLSGSVTISAYSSGPTSVSGVAAGFYTLGATGAWSGEAGSVSGAGGQNPLPGTATLSWNLTPTYKPCVVPNVVGQPQGAAQSAITKALCAVGQVSTEDSATVPKGDVISTNPTAGQTLPLGSQVALTVSDGPPCTVPGVAGEAQAAAEAAIKGAHCAVGAVTTQSSATVPKGHVISSSPAAGAVLKSNSPVALVVSSGPSQQCVVPNVVGQPKATARTALRAAHCAVGAVTKQTSATVPKGDVIATSPAAGAVLAKGTKVALVVSSGRKPGAKVCVVPKLAGMKLAKAKRKLRAAHCRPGKVRRKHSKKVAKGRVISTHPRAHKRRRAGTKVTLVVSEGPKKKH